MGSSMMQLGERETAGDQSAPGDGEGASPAASSDLDKRIAIALRLLPQVRSLPRTDLRALAVQLRVLSNVAETWAQRTERAKPS
jgi:hypothetical protein